MARVSSLVGVALFAIIVALGVVFADNDMNFAVNDDLIRTVNANRRNTWKAAHNHLTKKPVAELKRMLGLDLPTQERYTEAEMEMIERERASLKNVGLFGNLPEEFDSRTAWPGCIHPIRDQGRCGSCWAFAASEALSDRFCIASNGTVNVILSPQDMVSCDKLNFGCKGGILPLTWHYLKKSGVVSEECYSYKSGDGESPKCPAKCDNGEWDFKSDKYFVSNYGHIGSRFRPSQYEDAIMKELIAHGPVEAGFTVYQDFISYKSGVYQHTTGSQLGGHAVKIIGYGVDNGVKYWLIANSWNENWGENGFFRIRRGTNECGIEKGTYAGIPDLKRIPKH